ncbi:hypothetical protein CsatB_019549 [Cannabis sativa]|uniref:Dirigent protein n=1 Tax=Cannabis sativa TaxID=3483 RepID=A0A803QPE5_CANSA|nr:dirigent protein 21-like [Cannabis sativa]
MDETHHNTTLIILILFLTIHSSILSLTTAHDDYTYSRNLNPQKTLGLNKKQEKLTHLHFYFHDVVSGPNPTAIRVAEAKTTNTSAVSFGFVVVCDDPLTVGPEPTSKKIGSAQGIYASTSQTELSLLMALNYVFTEGKYKGSTLSILGRNAVLSGVREMPIVGGSGVFRFARGFALAKTYVANATTFDAIVEYNVYVLHY